MRWVSLKDARTLCGHDTAVDGVGVDVGLSVGADEGVALACVGAVLGLALTSRVAVGCGAAVVDGLVVGVDVAQATSRIGSRATTRWRRPGR